MTTASRRRRRSDPPSPRRRRSDHAAGKPAGGRASGRGSARGELGTPAPDVRSRGCLNPAPRAEGRRGDDGRGGATGGGRGGVAGPAHPSAFESPPSGRGRESVELGVGWVPNTEWIWGARGWGREEVEFATWPCKEKIIAHLLALGTGKLRPREGPNSTCPEPRSRRKHVLLGCRGNRSLAPNPGVFHSLTAPHTLQKQTKKRLDFACDNRLGTPCPPRAENWEANQVKAPTRPLNRLRREGVSSDGAGRLLNTSLRRGFISGRGPGRIYKSRG